MFAKSIEVTRLLLLICIVFESCLSSPIPSELSEGITHSEDESQKPEIPEELTESYKFKIPLFKFYHDDDNHEYDDEYEDILKSEASSPSISEDQLQSLEIPEELTETKFEFSPLPNFSEFFDDTEWKHENLMPKFDYANKDKYEDTVLNSEATSSSPSVSEDKPQKPEIPEELTETKFEFSPLPNFSEFFDDTEWKHENLMPKFDYTNKDKYEDTVLNSEATSSSPSVSEDKPQKPEIPEELTETKFEFSLLPNFSEFFDEWRHKNMMPKFGYTNKDKYEDTRKELLLNSEATSSSPSVSEDELQEPEIPEEFTEIKFDKPDDSSPEIKFDYKIWHDELVAMYKRQNLSIVIVEPEENSLSEEEEDYFDLKDYGVSEIDVEHATEDAMKITDVTQDKYNKVIYGLDKVIKEILAFEDFQATSIGKMIAHLVINILDNIINIIQELKEEDRKKERTNFRFSEFYQMR